MAGFALMLMSDRAENERLVSRDRYGEGRSNRREDVDAFALLKYDGGHRGKLISKSYHSVVILREFLINEAGEQRASW